MQIRLSEILSAAAGVIIFDLIFCHVVAPKIFKALELAPKKHGSCGCADTCACEAKNITDRGQVIDVSPLKQYSVIG